MVTETDDRGRLYLPKDLRDRHGERFRVVDLSSRVVLIPVDDDPLEAVRGAVGERLAGRSVAELEREARSAAREAVDAEVEGRERRRDGSGDGATTEQDVRRDRLPVRPGEVRRLATAGGRGRART